MKIVLFVCVRNSGRSQMEEAFFNHLAKGKGVAISAGTKPAAYVNPTVTKVMLEVGIDISSQKPKPLILKMLENADRVITMGCCGGEICPASLAPAEGLQVEDPEGEPIEVVRQIRDEIRNKVVKLVNEL